MSKMKKILALALIFVLALGLVACGGGETPGNTDTADISSGTSNGTSNGNADTDSVQATDSENSDSSDKDGDKTPVSNMFLACDQLNKQIVLYDLDLLQEGDDLEDAMVWELDADYCADMKYREDTVFGDVIITTRGMYSYPSGETIWECGIPGDNTHAVEILPDGDIVFANSTGGTVRYFNSSVLANDPKADVKWKDYPLRGAHGVVYDPEYEVLWALGSYELTGFIVESEGIKEVKGLGAMLPEGNQNGHDLAADYTDSRYLYLTSTTVLRFDKEECKFIKTFPQYQKLSNKDCKGFGNNQNNNFVYIVIDQQSNTTKPWADKDIAAWCSDKVYFAYWERENYLKVTEYVSSFRAFYKTRTFIGTYQ